MILEIEKNKSFFAINEFHAFDILDIYMYDTRYFTTIELHKYLKYYYKWKMGINMSNNGIVTLLLPKFVGFER